MLIIKYLSEMNKKAVEETFEALFALTELREIYRKKAPLFKFNKEQLDSIKDILKRIRNSLDIIEDELTR